MRKYKTDEPDAETRTVLAKTKGESKNKVKKEFIIFKNGTEKEILSRAGKYYVCEGTRFRIANPDIERVETRDPEEKHDAGFEKIPDVSDIMEEDMDAILESGRRKTGTAKKKPPSKKKPA